MVWKDGKLERSHQKLVNFTIIISKYIEAVIKYKIFKRNVEGKTVDEDNL